MSNLQRIVAADFGSTTTKLILFEKSENGWSKKVEASAPTTVERPVSNICIGLLNAVRELEEVSDYKIWENDNWIFDISGNRGIDIFLATSSAGGGLQILIFGLTKAFSVSRTNQAALGAGAIILDSLSLDDERSEIEKVDLIRGLKPDIIVMSGGTDSGATEQIIEIAQTILQAESKPRFTTEANTPIIYAGNKVIAGQISEILSDKYHFLISENVSPTIAESNQLPVRNMVHKIFMEHVMSQSPGYDHLSKLVSEPIIPTPSAVGDIIQSFAETNSFQVLAADIGGATTDIFSSVKKHQEKAETLRSVSANLGMSYSIANVLFEAGIDAIKKWLPFKMENAQITNIIKNKMIRPSTIPQSLNDLVLEQSIGREALRLALKHHEELFFNTDSRSNGFKSILGKAQKKGIDMKDITHIIGAGGILSHAPNRLSAAQIIIESFGTKGITEIFIDSVFMLPHLGAISKISKEIASQILLTDCLIPICIHIAPIGRKDKLAEIFVNDETHILRKGELKLVKFDSTQFSIKLSSGVILSNDHITDKSYSASTNFQYLILDGRNGDFSDRKLSYTGLNLKYE